MNRPMFVKPNKYTAKHFAQLLAAIIDVTANGDSKAVVVPMAKSISGDYLEVNDDCEFRVVGHPCEQECWKGIDQPPVTKTLEIMTGSMLTYICTECGGLMYIDHPDPREVRDIPYAEQKFLSSTYNQMGRALNWELHEHVQKSRKRVSKHRRRKAQNDKRVNAETDKSVSR